MQRLQHLPRDDEPESSVPRAKAVGAKAVGAKVAGGKAAACAVADPPPLILWADDPRRGRLVVACCPLSMAMGVRVAMPIAQAVEMVRSAGCRSSRAEHPPQVEYAPRVEQHAGWLDQQGLQRIATRFQHQISPQVAIEMLDERPWARFGQPANVTACSPHQPESLLCEISGVAHLFDGETGLLQAARRLLAKQGLKARMAIADSVGAAWALAHHASQSTCSAQSVVNNEGQVFAWIVPAGQSLQAVSSLPVEALRLTQPTVDTLHRLGVEQIDQLLNLPRSGLASRLGKSLLRRIEQATGESDEPLVVHRPPADHSYQQELEYPTTDLEILANRIGQLIEAAKERLAVENHGVLQLACRMHLVDHPALTFEIGLFAPTLDVDHLSGLMIHQLEHRTLPSSVVRLEVMINLSGPLRSNQVALFRDDRLCKEADDHPLKRVDPAGISRLVNALSNRLGRDAVLGVAIDDDPLPENAYRVWPLTANPRRISGSRSRKSSTAVNRVSSHPAVSSRDESPAEVEKVMRTDRRIRSQQAQGLHDPSPDDAMRRPLSLFVHPIPLLPVGRNTAGDRQLPDRFRLDGKL